MPHGTTPHRQLLGCGSFPSVITAAHCANGKKIVMLVCDVITIKVEEGTNKIRAVEDFVLRILF